MIKISKQKLKNTQIQAVSSLAHFHLFT